MATPLKYMYNPQYFEAVCPILEYHIPNFDSRDFIFRIFNNEWPDLELRQRVRHITRALHHFLPKDFPAAVDHLVAVAKELENRGNAQAFRNSLLPDYVEVYGRQYPEESLRALEQITRLVSSEF